MIYGIKNNKADIIQKHVPNSEYRKRILNELTPIMPQKKTDYEISFKFGECPLILRVERPDDDQILSYIGPYEVPKKEKPTEAVIQARCLARLKEDGKVDKIINILNYELFEEMDLRPYRTTEIHWLNRTFILSHEIACDVHKEDSVVVIEYEPLKIRAFNFSRKDAIKDFAEEFACVWDNYAKESDKNLTSDAISVPTLAGLPITEIMTTAPGNDAPLGGVKVVIDDGSWFALRPSGTEPKMKFYIESFGGEKRWQQIHDEALSLIFE